MEAIDDGARGRQGAALHCNGAALQLISNDITTIFTLLAALQDANTAFCKPAEKVALYGKLSGETARRERYCGCYCG
ncbi:MULTISPECIES: hypothetical protein [unclassified Janthinobacterium]|uniref:hypothetical protein n=1 Tax=unclassified Janthinobacterium TaxID=2610881 RepID=UPI001300C330|nr:hypothetical protein [Janthinobacterium sp. CG_23.4]MDH6156697.1 hypothetical protein [Janthinobacterium sp. CG_23.4]